MREGDGHLEWSQYITQIEEAGKSQNRNKRFCHRSDIPKYYIIFVCKHETCYLFSSSHRSLQVVLHLSTVGFSTIFECQKWIHN